MQAQSAYLIGTSQASIEPDKSQISLTLGGYGFPIDGRFTLEWVKKGEVSEVSAIGGLNDKLYVISKSNLLWINPSENNPEWKVRGKVENIISLAGWNGKLYAVNITGELLETKEQGGLKWKKIGSVDNSVTSLAASDKKLFAANGNGTLWSTDISKKNIEWIKCETVKSIVSLAANEGKVYALTNDGVIYQYEPGKKIING